MGRQELQARFHRQILSKTGALEASRRPRQALFRWLIGELRQRGHERRGEWPFNVQKLGYVSICRYIDKVLQVLKSTISANRSVISASAFTAATTLDAQQGCRTGRRHTAWRARCFAGGR